MKNILLFIFTSFISVSSAQTNFKWEAVDSISKTKEQIYSDTKLFIAEYWKSANDVIQNEDKEVGNILLKGKVVKNVNFMMNVYTYVYSYTVTFKMKDGKLKIIIDNVYCDAARFSGAGTITKIEPFDNNNSPETGTMLKPGLPKKKAIIMMAEVKAELQKVIDDYLLKMKAPSTKEGEW